MDLALNNLQRLICHKTQPTNQSTAACAFWDSEHVRLWHWIEAFNFIAQNLQHIMSWEPRLKQNPFRYQLKWFVMFEIPSTHVISCVRTKMNISSNTYNALKYSTLVLLYINIYILLNGFKYSYVSQIIQLKICHLVTHS